MKNAWVLLIARAAYPACILAALNAAARADVVVLKNGQRMEGKVTDNRMTTGEVILETGGGRVMLRSSQVEKIEAEKPREGVAGERVTVKLPRGGADYYGVETLEGTLVRGGAEDVIVLEVPGGKITMPWDKQMVVKKVEETAAPMPAAATTPPDGTIKTTHEVLLLNGRKITGNLVPTSADEPVKLMIGSMGSVMIPRSRIAPDGIKEASGSIQLPPEPPKEAAPATQAPLTPQSIDEMKRQLRAEILRELLDQIINEKVGPAPSESTSHYGVPAELQEGLTDEQAAEVEDAVYELGRQRTQNRVRAERHLVDFGSAALPFLELAASHPFELTRRAVQRIVRDIGDVRGAPLAFEALNDPDDFVRSLAREALEKVMPSTIEYDVNAPVAARLEAQNKYRALWDGHLRAAARESILRKIAFEK